MTDGNTSGRDYVVELRRMLREWNWPEWAIDDALPKIVHALLGLGILERVSWGYEPTMKAESEEAWTRLKIGDTIVYFVNEKGDVLLRKA